MFQWESETDSSDKYLPSIYYVKIPWTKEPAQLPFLGSPKGLSTKPHCVLHAGVSTRLTAQSSEQNNQKSLMGERENQISNTNGALESDECSREKVKPWKATGSEEKHSSKQRSQEGWRLSEDLTGLRAWAGGEEGRGFQAEGSSRAPALEEIMAAVSGKDKQDSRGQGRVGTAGPQSWWGVRSWDPTS